jgi:hypothetical protein
MSCDPNQLINDARRVNSIVPHGMQMAMMISVYAEGSIPVPGVGVRGEGGEWLLDENGQHILPE